MYGRFLGNWEKCLAFGISQRFTYWHFFAYLPLSNRLVQGVYGVDCWGPHLHLNLAFLYQVFEEYVLCSLCHIECWDLDFEVHKDLYQRVGIGFDNIHFPNFGVCGSSKFTMVGVYNTFLMVYPIHPNINDYTLFLLKNMDLNKKRRAKISVFWAPHHIRIRISQMKTLERLNVLRYSEHVTYNMRIL